MGDVDMRKVIIINDKTQKKSNIVINETMFGIKEEQIVVYDSSGNPLGIVNNLQQNFTEH
jgi:hypothetical protein